MEGSITSILNKVPRIVTGMESDTEIKGTDRYCGGKRVFSFTDIENVF